MKKSQIKKAKMVWKVETSDGCIGIQTSHNDRFDVLLTIARILTAVDKPLYLRGRKTMPTTKEIKIWREKETNTND
jgi:hypothetical protein